MTNPLVSDFLARAYEAKTRALNSKPRTIAEAKYTAQANAWYDAAKLLEKELEK
jgi:hypothetical protein